MFSGSQEKPKQKCLIFSLRIKQICLMRQLNDRPKSQTAKTSSEQVPYRSLVCKHKSSFAALLLLFPKSLRLFGNPYTSERLMYCGALGQHSACRQAGVPVGTLTRRKRQAKNYFKKGRKRIWKTDLSEPKMWLRN